MTSNPIFSHLILDKSSGSFPLPQFSPCTHRHLCFCTYTHTFPPLHSYENLSSGPSSTSISGMHTFIHTLFFHSTHIYRMCALCWTQCSGDGQWEARSLPLRSLSLVGEKIVRHTAYLSLHKLLNKVHTTHCVAWTTDISFSPNWKLEVQDQGTMGSWWEPTFWLADWGLLLKCRFWFSRSGMGPDCLNVAEREKTLMSLPLLRHWSHRGAPYHELI